MQDANTKQRFELTRKDVEATVSSRKQAKIDLSAAIERLAIELDTLKVAVEHYHPGMSKSYLKFREEARARNRKTRAT